MGMMAHPGFQGAVFGLTELQNPAMSGFDQSTHDFLLRRDSRSCEEVYHYRSWCFADGVARNTKHIQCALCFSVSSYFMALCEDAILIDYIELRARLLLIDAQQTQIKKMPKAFISGSGIRRARVN